MADDDNNQQMGIWMTSALVIGTIIGAGIFMLPVSLAPLGANVLIGWLVSGVGVMCIVFALAQLSRLSGDGIQANIEREFGPTTAFLVAWSFWFSNWVAAASVAIGGASALSFIGLASPGTVVPLAIACVIVITAVNAIGVRAAGGLSIITVLIKVIPLLAVIWLFAERGVGGEAYEPLAPMPITIASIATATALTFFALTGFESATAPVGKIRNPEKTIPRALFGGTIVVLVLYLIAGTSIQMLLPADVIVKSSAPFADALVSRWGHGVASFAALTIAISAFGCLNGLILSSGELGYSMALRGDLPAIVTRTRGANTPVVSQIVVAVLISLLLLANSSRGMSDLYTFIVLLSTAGIIVLYFVGALAAWKANQALHARSIVAGALLFTAFAAYGTGLEACFWGLVLLAFGLAIRAGMRRFNSMAETNLPAVVSPAAPPGSSA